MCRFWLLLRFDGSNLPCRGAIAMSVYSFCSTILSVCCEKIRSLPEPFVPSLTKPNPNATEKALHRKTLHHNRESSSFLFIAVSHTIKLRKLVKLVLILPPCRHHLHKAAVRKEIQDETDRETGRTKQISNVPIHISIYSPNVVNLTLIDLPGLIKVAAEGQPNSIVQDIENMVRSYIEKATLDESLYELAGELLFDCQLQGVHTCIPNIIRTYSFYRGGVQHLISFISGTSIWNCTFVGVTLVEIFNHYLNFMQHLENGPVNSSIDDHIYRMDTTMDVMMPSLRTARGLELKSFQ